MLAKPGESMIELRAFCLAASLALVSLIAAFGRFGGARWRYFTP